MFNHASAEAALAAPAAASAPAATKAEPAAANVTSLTPFRQVHAAVFELSAAACAVLTHQQRPGRATIAEAGGPTMPNTCGPSIQIPCRRGLSRRCCLLLFSAMAEAVLQVPGRAEATAKSTGGRC